MTKDHFRMRRLTSKGAMLLCSALVGMGTAAPAQAEDAQPARSPADPFEHVNRAFFSFHQVLDRILLRPAAIGYKRIAPRPLRTGLRNAISNLGEPAIAVNDILQGHGKKAGRTMTRFVGDSTFGLFGLFDVATPAGLPHHPNDFGVTLARYGVKPGPYLFIPLVGPSTVRDAVGKLAGLGLDPLIYARYPGDTEVGVTSAVAGGLDTRAAADSDLKALQASATDLYASFRSYYLQNRQAEITGGKIDLDTLPDFGDPTPSPASAAIPAPAPPAPQASPPQ